MKAHFLLYQFIAARITVTAAYSRSGRSLRNAPTFRYLMIFLIIILVGGSNMELNAQSFSATLSSNQKFAKPLPASYACGGTYGSFTSINSSSTLFSYATQAFTVSTAGDYTIEVTSSSASDPMLYIYTSFNPSSPNSNFKVGDDDSGSGLLSKIGGCGNNFSAGTYVIVVTAYSSSTTSGTVNFSISGAGTTTVMPSITTSTASSVTSSSATVGGNVTSDGGATVTARGVAYGTSSNPTSGISIGSGTGSFSSSISGLTPGTLYYARAYATNSVGTNYGPQVSFTTQNFTPPSVSTSSTTNIERTTATFNGNVSSTGGQNVSAGFQVSTNSSFSGASSVTSTNSMGTGNFSYNYSGLTGSTLYYVRTWATNNGGTTYGSSTSFYTDHTITYSANANGSISGSTTQVIDHNGTTSAVTAVPASGYHFLRWSDNSTSNPRTDASVTSSFSRSATFEVNSLEFTSQPGNTIAGQGISFVVRIRDSYSNTMTNSDREITVALASNPAGGTLAGTLTATSVNGVATFSLPYIQKTGAYTVTVSATGLTPATSSSFTIIPAALSYFTVDNVTTPHEAGQFTSPRVTAYDIYNNVKTNYTGTVTFSSNNVSMNSAKATVLPAAYTFASSDNGVKTFTNQLNLKQYGTGYYVRVNDGAAQGEQINIQVTSAPLNFYTIKANSNYLTHPADNNILAGTDFSATAFLYDEFGNLKLDYTGGLVVTFTTNANPSPLGNPAVLPSAASRTFTNGVCTISGFTFYNAQQTPTITIVESMTGSTGTTPAITVWPEVLANFLVKEEPVQDHGIGGVRVISNESFSVKVTARDQYNNIKRDYLGYINFKSSNDAIVVDPVGLQQFLVEHAGIRTFSGVSIPTTGSYWLRVADSPNAYKTGELQNIVVGPNVQNDVNSELFFVSHPTLTTYPNSPEVVAGDFINVTIRPRDAGNNLLCDCQTVSVMLNGENQHRNGALVSGVPALVSIPVVDNHDGTYSASVRVTDMSITNVITASVNATVLTDQLNVDVNQPHTASLATTVITAVPTAITADESSVVTVQLRDQFLNNRSTDDGTVTLGVTNLANGIIVGETTGSSSIVATYTSGGKYVATFRMNGIGLGTATIVGAFNDGGAVNGSIVDNSEVVVTHGVATQLAVNTQPSSLGNAVAGIAFDRQPVIHINDQWGNHVTTGAGSTLVVGAVKETGNSTLKGTLTATADAGVATFGNLYYELAESGVSLEFSATGLTETVSAPFTVVHNIPNYMVIRMANPVVLPNLDGKYDFTAGIAQDIKVTAYDIYGNLANRFTGNRVLTFSGANPSPNPGEVPKVNSTNFPNATTLNFVNGEVTAALTLYKEEDAMIAANHTAAYTDSYVNGNININAAGDNRLPVSVDQNTPAYFSVTIAGNLTEVTAGQSYTVTVSSFDYYNNPATFYTGNKTLKFNGAAISPAPSTSPTIGGTILGDDVELNFNSNGQATATMVLYKAETGISITAAESAASGVETRVGYELDLNVNHGAANYFAITGTPGAMTAGTTQTVTVRAYDTWNNIATGYTGAKDIVFTGATPSPDNAPASGSAPTVTNNASSSIAFGTATAMTFTSGAATGTMALYKEQDIHITATQGSITTPVITGYDYRLAVNVGHAAANYFAVTGTSATMTAGTSQTITVTLYDQFNNVATTYDGDKLLSFSGANVSELSNAPTVVSEAFGNQTTLTFADGIASGTMFLYKAENAAIKVSNGSQNTSNSFDLEVTVNPNVAHNLAITTQPAHSTTEAIAGVTFSTQPVVRVRDVYGNLVSDNTTVISAERGSNGTANLFGTLTATASGGVASFAGLNYQKAEDMNILFSSGSLQTVTSNSLSVVHNVPSYLTVSGVSTQTAGVAQTITVRAFDSYNNLALRFDGSKALTFNGANVSPAPSTSPSMAATAFGSATTLSFTDGVATGSMILYKEETAYVGATHTDASFSDSYTGATNLSIAAVNPNGLEVVVSQAAPAYFAISGSATQTAGTAQEITVRAFDEFNNLATDYTGSKMLRFSGANESLTPSTNPTVSATNFGNNTALTFNNGVATMDMTLYKDEVAVVIATEISGGTAGQTDGTTGITTPDDIGGYVYRLSVDVDPNTAYYFAVTGNATQTAGDAQTITVTAYDQWNNVALGYSGAKDLTFSGASNSPGSPKSAVSPTVAATAFGTSTSLSFTSGVATGSMILTKVETAYIKVIEGSIATSDNYDLHVAVNHAANNYFAVTGSSTQTAGVAQTITITMYDAYNNIATSYDGTKSLMFSGAEASLYGNSPTVNGTNFGSATNVVFSSGVANAAPSASMILTKAANTTVFISGDGINTATGLDLTVNVGHNLATNLRIDTQPSAYVRAGDVLAQQPVISIRDAYGNLVDDDATQITASADGTTELVGTRTLTAEDGIVSFSGLSYRTMESITIGFTSSPALTARTSGNVVVDHNATYKFEFTTVPTYIIAGGQRGAYVVNRYDAHNNLVNNVVNSNGSDNNIAERVYLYSDFTGHAGFTTKFYTALTGGSEITYIDIANATTTASFWYYSTEAGDHLITGSDVTPLDNPDATVLNAVHNTLEVRPAALSHFIVTGVGTPVGVDGFTEHYYGDVQTVTVEAIDILGNRKTNYNGTITFNLTDNLAVAGTNYPSDYTFTAGDGAGLDNGIHTFTNSILFTRPSFEHPDFPAVNEWWVTAVDQAQPSKYGSQVKIKVLARPITVTAHNQTKNYYGDTHSLGTTSFTVTSSLANIYAYNQSVTAVTLTSSGTVNTATVGDYNIVPSNATGINSFNPEYYTITYVDGTLTVVPRPITITATAGQNKVYSTVDPTFAYSITSASPYHALVNSDAFTGGLARTGGENVATNYAIEIGSLDIINGVTDKSANYSITYISNDFEITPWPLVLSNINAANKTYDANNDATLTFNDNRPIVADGITFDKTADFSDENVNWNGSAADSKTVSYSVVISGGTHGGNYIFSSASPNTSASSASWTGSTTATITQRPINVTAQAVSRIYDGTTASYNADGNVLPIAQTSQLVGTDAITNVGVQTYNNANVGENKLLTPSGATISDGNNGHNYAITYVTQNLGEITKREITVAIDGDPTKVYDATNAATLVAGDYTIGNLVPGESMTINQTTGTYNNVNVGTSPDRTVSVNLAEANYVAGSGTLLSNYTLPVTATGDGTITKYPLTLSNFAAANKTYDGTTPTTITFDDDVIGSDDVTFGYTANFSDRNVNWASSAAQTKTVSYAVNFSGDDAGNYMFATDGDNTGSISSWEGTTTAKINQRPITVAVTAGQNKTYGDNDPTSYAATVSGLDPLLGTGDQITGSVDARVTGESVSNYAIERGNWKIVYPAGSDADMENNYAITFTSADFEITRLAIALTPNSEQKKIYGDSDPLPFTYTTVPEIGTTLSNGSKVTLSGELTRVAGHVVGLYNILQGDVTNETNGNYNISYTSNVKFEIERKNIAINVIAGQTKEYGDVNPTYTYTTTPAENALPFNAEFIGALVRETGENVATDYTITQGTLELDDDNNPTASLAQNYNITFTSADYAITRKAIAITVTSAQQKVYGESDPSSGQLFAFTTVPALASLPFQAASWTGALLRETGEVVGTEYTITQGSLELVDGQNALGGSLATNYTVTFNTADFAITRKPITITVNAGIAKTYGDDDPAFTFTTSPALESLPFNAGWTGNLVRLNGNNNVNAYAITQGSLELTDNNNGTASLAQNYTVNYVGNNLTINKRNITITVTAGQNKVYAANDPLFAYTSSVNPLYYNGSFNGPLSRDAGENVAINYAIGRGDLQISDDNNATSLDVNYNMTFVPANFAITKKPITITVVAGQNKRYGFADPTSSPTAPTYFRAFEFESSVDPLPFSGNFIGTLERTGVSNSPVDTYPISRGTLNINDANNNTTSLDDNYQITFAGSIFVINERLLTLVATDQTKTYGFGPEWGSSDPNYWTLGSTLFTVSTTAGDGMAYSETIGGVGFTSSGEPRDANTGTYVISINSGSETESGGFLKSNYQISYVTGELEVTPRTLHLSNFAADNKVYDGTNVATGLGFSDDRVNNDNLAFTRTAVFDNANAGSGKTVNYTSIVISGGTDKDNYMLETETSHWKTAANRSISQKALTITANSLTKYFGNSYVFTGTEFTTTQMITGESVASATLVSAGAASDAAIAHYSIVISDPIASVGTLLANYSVTLVNGDLNVIDPLTILGKVYYYKRFNIGTLTRTDLPMEGVEVKLYNSSNNLLGTAYTDNQGIYQFNLIDQATVAKIVVGTSLPWGSVSANDALAMQLKIVQSPPTYWQSPAYNVDFMNYVADINNSSTLSIQDVLGAKYRILNPGSYQFPAGNWRYYAEGSSFTPLTFESNSSASLANPQLVNNYYPNIYARVVGDMDGDYNPNPAKELIPIQEGEALLVNNGEYFDFDIRLKDVLKFSATSLVLQFDESKVEVESLISLLPDHEYVIEGNQIRIVWTSLTSLDMEANDVLVSLKMRTIAPVTWTDHVIHLSSTSVFGDGMAEMISGVELIAPPIENNLTDLIGFDESKLTLGLFPNPVKDWVTVSYGLPAYAEVKIALVDMMGVTVSELIENELMAGAYTFRFNANHLNLDMGVYSVRMHVKSNGKSYVRIQKLVHIK